MYLCHFLVLANVLYCLGANCLFSDVAGDVSEPREPLEQLEDDDSMAEREEEEDEEEGEEEEEEDGVNVKMQTPHLLPRPPSPTSRQGTSQQSRGR